MAGLPEHLITTAARYANVPYLWGAADPAVGLDCSGFVLVTYQQAGVPFEGVRSAEQIRAACVPISWDQVQPGDLVFLTGTYDSPDPATHVAISLGVGSHRVWSAQDPCVAEVEIGTNPYWQEHLLSAGRHPQVPATPLATTAELLFDLNTIYPVIGLYAGLYGVDPRIVAAVAYQESGFRNFQVHADGTGHGLFGLDDGGELVNFERWCGSTFGRGATAGMMPPVLQVEFVCAWFADAQVRYGDALTACQAWHRGPTLWPDAAGQNYRALIEAHVQTLFGGSLA